jgi:hypothetical protein
MQIPRSGLLIWHINEHESNSTEETKQCDLECADGRYLDRGFPLGLKPHARQGGDNLDFWSHDSGWNMEYAGNLGDATDVFDGVTYTEFSDRTNPNPHSDINPTAESGIEITNIRREGEEMVFDCKIAYRPAMQPPPLPIISMGYQRSKPKTPARPEAEKNTAQKTWIRESEKPYPSAPEIFQNHPNPFNAETVIPYRIMERGPAVLEVFNILGQKVLERDQGIRERGYYTARLNAKDFSSGVYLYRLRGAVFSQTKRFFLIR